MRIGLSIRDVCLNIDNRIYFIGVTAVFGSFHNLFKGTSRQNAGHGHDYAGLAHSSPDSSSFLVNLAEHIGRSNDNCGPRSKFRAWENRGAGRGNRIPTPEGGGTEELYEKESQLATLKNRKLSLQEDRTRMKESKQELIEKCFSGDR
jgi:hypothetical protein